MNQTLNPRKPPSRFSSYKLSKSFTESLSNQIIKTSSKISLVREIENNLVVIKQSANEEISKDVHLDRNKSYVVKLVCFHNPNDFWIRLNSKDQCHRKLSKKMDQKYPINGSNDFFTEEELTKLKIGINLNSFQYELHLIIS